MLNDDSTPPMRETILSYLAGAVFAIAWWIWIDAHAYAALMDETNKKDLSASPTFPHYLPGIVSSIALILINTVSWQDLGGLSWGMTEDHQPRVRAWFFFSLVVGFCGIISALWVGIEHWLNVDSALIPTKWPGAALILENVLIFISAMMYKFGKPLVESSESTVPFL